MALLAGITLTSFLSTFVICLLITLAIRKWFRERKYPPGPAGIPVFGYSLFLGKKPNEKLRDLSKKYGGVFSFYMGSELYICVSDYHLAKDLLSNPLLLYRPTQNTDFMIGRGGFGGMNGEEWQEQRRFAFYTMRNLGLGKGLWETMIQESVADFVEEVRNWKGKPTNIEEAITFSQSSCNISLLFGRHLDKVKDAENVKIIRDSTREFMAYFSPVSINIGLPFLRKFMEIFRLGGYDRFFELLRKFENIFRKEVEERMQSPDSLNIDDFIGCFFRELQKKKKETPNHSFTMQNLMGNLFILFIAGNDSTMSSISWLLLLMAHHQDIQKKVHEEIDANIGRDGKVSYDDRAKFPYTIATLFEMFRWVAISAIFPLRLAMDDIEVNGYTLPKGSMVITNMWAIMHDPKYFENPDKFKPERFIAENGKVFKMDGYAPFSIGKRNCPGEGVAIMSVFLYFVSIMQKFKVTMPPGKVVDFEPVFGGALLSKPQEICFVER